MQGLGSWVYVVRKERHEDDLPVLRQHAPWGLGFGVQSSCLPQSIFEAALQKSIPTQIHHLILRISKCEEYVDGLVGERLLKKDVQNASCEISLGSRLRVWGSGIMV